jgi:FkbM family methyltransferase
MINQNIYDLSLHHMGRSYGDAFIVVIGAMDGVSFDETRGYISTYGWNGLFVEPIPEQFERLQLLYSGTNSICENSAISTYNGNITMLRIKQDVIDRGLVHPCFGGMSAIYPPKNGLSSEGDKDTVEKYGELINVKCITPETLFDKHSISKIDILSIDTEGHDLEILKNISLKKYNPKIVRIEYINLSKEDKLEAIKYLEDNNYVYTISGQNLDAVHQDYWKQVTDNAAAVISSNETREETSNTTIVTGIWDLGRGDLSEGWSRNFSHYIEKFEELIQNLKNVPLIVFIDPKHENIVWKHRSKSNTVVYHQTKEQFNSDFFPFFNEVQKIRNNPDWYNQVGWLKDSTQAQMEWYNPVIMSKMFMLHNAKCLNPFGTDYFFWLDGGITNTVYSGYFSQDKVLSKIEKLVKKFLFVCFPYETTTEIHGFDINAMKKIANSNTVNRVARGGFFGGHKDYISAANDLYYSLLRDTLNEGLMGTEESLFTLMTYLDPEIYKYEEIQDNGLINTFFENVKNNNTKLSQQISTRINPVNNNTVLYINAFNSPEQLQMVIDSFEKYDTNFLTKTEKYLINNTTKEELFPKYDIISTKYGFTEIRKGNIGVCGGRQLAAEHFAELGSKYMMFFEDDMLVDLEKNTQCVFGLSKYVNNLFNNLIRIMDLEHYDFLKFSFSEFYGHNGEQWSWHNVPTENRIKYFGNINKKPLTKFKHIKTNSQVAYAEGEIYYSNWPHIIDQEGNKKLFLDTKWAKPFEQTWMSHIYTLTVEDKVNAAILLSSPITHNRVHFYEAEERKEN